MSRLMLDDSPPPLSAADSDDDSSGELLARRLALSNSLAASYPAAALSNALRDAPGASALDDDFDNIGGDDDDEDDDGNAEGVGRGRTDPLSRSCFASLRASPNIGGGAGSSSGGSDLGDLDWLVNYRPPDLMNPVGAASSAGAAQTGLTVGGSVEPPSGGKSVGSASVKRESTARESLFATANHKFHSDYDPHKDRLLKPPYSFSCLIFMALEAAPNKCLPVRRIYQWIEQKFPFYRHAQNGWKNSVRHNLSLNKSFTKVHRDASAKGSLWTIDPMARAGMLQALKKTPYHPYAQVQMFSANGTMYKTGSGVKRETRSPMPLQQQQQQQQKQQLQQHTGLSYSGLLGTNVLLNQPQSSVGKLEDEDNDYSKSVLQQQQQQQEQQLMHYHPNVNSFKGHVTPVKGPQSLSQQQPEPTVQHQPLALTASTKSEAAADSADNEADEDRCKRQRCRKQDLLPSAHLYPFLAAKMKRLVHILGDQSSDAQSDASSLQRELRRQRGDIVDVDVDEEDEDEDEDGYVEIEQPIKRPRGRPRKDCAEMYRLLPPARLLKKKKRKRRSSSMPSVNQLVAAAQMAQMKRAATVSAAPDAKPLQPTVSSADDSIATNEKDGKSAVSSDTTNESKPSALPDAHSLYLKYRRETGKLGEANGADNSVDSASSQPRRLPPLLMASMSGKSADGTPVVNGGCAVKNSGDKIPIEEASVLASLALNSSNREPSAPMTSPAVKIKPTVATLPGSRVQILTSSSLSLKTVGAAASPAGKFSVSNGNNGGVVVKLAARTLN